MKKQQTNRPLLTDELDQINFGGTEQEVRELFEQEALPSPSELEKYDQLMPGGAERVFNLIEDERMRRYEIELKRIGGRNRLNQLISASGLVLGIFLFLAVITTSIWIDNSSFLLICLIIVLMIILAPLLVGRMKDKN